jgi:hypothetical protein
LGRPGAAAANADLLLALADGAPLPDPGLIERSSRQDDPPKLGRASVDQLAGGPG